jgi:hypothetical protein
LFNSGALKAANARVASLEAELEASRTAFDAATAAKVNAKKSAKSALAKAKKAEKDQATAKKEHLQREQAMAKWLNQMFAAAGGTITFFYFVSFLALLCLLMYSFSAVCCFPGFAEYSEVSASSLHPDKDPLLAAVSLLEANWISVREIFELVNRVLTWIFVRLWPNKKANVPDLKNLAKAFDTDDDPILTMKGLSLKRGAEGAIAFAYAHGEEVNWGKVSSSPGRPRLELKPFFEKARKYAPGIMSMISPSAASVTGTTPISLTPATSGSMPPPDDGAASATDREAEVA